MQYLWRNQLGDVYSLGLGSAACLGAAAATMSGWCSLTVGSFICTLICTVICFFVTLRVSTQNLITFGILFGTFIGSLGTIVVTNAPNGDLLKQYYLWGAANFNLEGVTVWDVIFSLSLCGKTKPVSLATRLLCLFIGVVTVFLVSTASAKMLLYIGSYGLTWSRVTTEVFMLWLALTTVLVAIRLFLPKFGYMKAVVLTAMVPGTLVFWVDVESLVVNYNVNAYRSGKLETVDVNYLNDMGAAAIPRLLELTEDENQEVAKQARDILDRRNNYVVEDFRDWNFTKAKADTLLSEYHAQQEEALRAEVLEMLGLDVSAGTLLRTSWGKKLSWENGKRMLEFDFDSEDEEALVEQLKAAQWQAVPISSRMQATLNRDTALFREFRDIYLTNTERKGYWFFRDLHPEATDPADPSPLLTREEYRFLLAYYNTRNNVLYIFQVDRPANAEQ